MDAFGLLSGLAHGHHQVPTDHGQTPLLSRATFHSL